MLLTGGKAFGQLAANNEKALSDINKVLLLYPKYVLLQWYSQKSEKLSQEQSELGKHTTCLNFLFNLTLHL